MANRREALVFVPGLTEAAAGEQLDLLCHGIIHASEQRRVVDEGEIVVEGLSGRRFSIASGSERTELDVFECYWNDLVPDIDKLKPIDKMLQGFSLLWFWILSRAWGLVIGNLWLGFTMLLAGVVLLAWYLTVVVVGLDALGAVQAPQESGLVSSMLAGVRFVGERLGSVTTWLGVSYLLSLIGAVRLANISHFTRKYLQERELRNKIRRRLTTVLFRVLECDGYDRLSVAGHSFGGMIGIDALADLPNQGKEIRLVTLGVPLRLLRLVANWVRNEVDKFLASDTVLEWHDFNSSTDWLCSPDTNWIEARSERGVYRSKRLGRMGDVWQRVTGRTHSAYFHEQEPMELLTS